MEKHDLRDIHYKYRKIVLLDSLFMLGLLLYSIIFYVINNALEPLGIVGEQVKQRLFWRNIAEKICALSSTIYIVGHIFVIYNAIKQKQRFSIKQLSLYWGLQIAIMLVCVVPFGIFDQGYFHDYIFPLYSLVIAIVLLFIISSVSTRDRK